MNNRILKGYDCKVTQHSSFTTNKNNLVTGNFHYGVDIVPVGAISCDIMAHSDGVVKYIERNHNTTDTTKGSLGNYVAILHDNGYITWYCHLAPNTIYVKVGDRVTKGQVVGYMGQTGRATGIHCHFEVRIAKTNERINPEPFINADLPNLPTNAQNNEEIVQSDTQNNTECTVTDNIVEYTYKQGDTFGQVIINLGLKTKHGLWGNNGDVNYYTTQLHEQGIYGNIPIGTTIKLRKRID